MAAVPSSANVQEARVLAQVCWSQCRDSASSFRLLTSSVRKLRNTLEEVEELFEDFRQLGPDGLKLLGGVSRASNTLRQLDLALKAHQGSDYDIINDNGVADIKTDLDVIANDLSAAYNAVSTGEIQLQLDVGEGGASSSRAISTSSNTADSGIDRKSSCTSSAWSPTRSEGAKERLFGKVGPQAGDEKEVNESGKAYLEAASPDNNAPEVRRASTLDWRSPFGSPDPLSLSFEQATALIMTPDEDVPMSAVRSRSGTGSTVFPPRPVEAQAETEGASTTENEITSQGWPQWSRFLQTSKSEESLHRPRSGSVSPIKGLEPVAGPAASRHPSETTHLSPTSAATKFVRRSRTSSLSSITEIAEKKNEPRKRKHIADYAVFGPSFPTHSRPVSPIITTPDDLSTEPHKADAQNEEHVDRLRDSLSAVFGESLDDGPVHIALQPPSTPPREATPPSTPPRIATPAASPPRSADTSPTMPARKPPAPPAPRRSKKAARISSYRVVNAVPIDVESSDDELYTVSRPSSSTAAVSVPTTSAETQQANAAEDDDELYAVSRPSSPKAPSSKPATPIAAPVVNVVEEDELYTDSRPTSKVIHSKPATLVITPQVSVTDHDDEAGRVVAASNLQTREEDFPSVVPQSADFSAEEGGSSSRFSTKDGEMTDSSWSPREEPAKVHFFSADRDEVTSRQDTPNSPPALPKRPSRDRTALRDEGPLTPAEPKTLAGFPHVATLSRSRTSAKPNKDTSPKRKVEVRNGVEINMVPKADSGLGIQIPVSPSKERSSVDSTINGLKPSLWRETMGTYKNSWRQHRAASTSQLYTTSTQERSPPQTAQLRSPPQTAQHRSPPQTAQQVQAFPESAVPVLPSPTPDHKPGVAEWYAPGSNNIDLAGLETERQSHIIHFWNASKWQQAESYLVDYVSTLTEQNDLARARRVRHLLGVCSSFQGQLEHAISLFQSVIRSPVKDIAELDDGDCSAAYWLGDAYAQLNRRTEALLAYCIARHSSLFRTGDLAGLSTLIRLEQEAVMLGASKDDFKLRFAQEALRTRSPLEPVSLLDTKAVTMPAAKALLEFASREDHRPTMSRAREGSLQLDANLFRSSSFLKLDKKAQGAEYHRMIITAEHFTPNATWPMMYDPLFSITNVRKGRLLAYECDLVEVFSRNEALKVARSVGLNKVDCFTSNDIFWLIRNIRECLKMLGMGFSEIATVHTTSFMVRYSFMLNNIATTYYFSIAIFKQTLRAGYGVDICPDGVCSARIIRTNLDYDKGVNNTETKRIKKLIREYLDGVTKDKDQQGWRLSSFASGRRPAEAMPPPVPPRPQARELHMEIVR